MHVRPRRRRRGLPRGMERLERVLRGVHAGADVPRDHARVRRRESVQERGQRHPGAAMPGRRLRAPYDDFRAVRALPLQ